MTERERWIVYPLLFLALGSAIKDKMTEQVSCRTVFCNALVVTDRAGREQVIVASDSEGGLVRTRGNKNGLTVALGNTDRVAGLMLITPQGGARAHPGSIFVAEPKTPGAPAEGAPADQAPTTEAQPQEAPAEPGQP